MKNMLTRTALVSSVILSVSAAAQAQTTVTGNLALSYKTVSGDGVSTAVNNFRAFGKESQINLTNKGKFGSLDYVAGFSLEFDGNDASANNGTTTQNGTTLDGVFNENTYIDFIIPSTKTTFSIGADHIQNSDFTMTNLVGGVDFDDLVSGINNKATSFVATHNSNYGAYGIGIVQDVGAGKVSFNYTPSRATGQAMNDQTAISTTAPNTTTANFDTGESAYELGFRGDLGVKGLDVGVFYNNSHGGAALGGTSDLKGRMYAAKYNFGQVTVAGEKGIQTATTGIDTTSNSFALGYAIDNAWTIAISEARTEVDGATVKEKIRALSVGYALGAVSTSLNYGTVDNIGTTAGNDGTSLMGRVNVNF
jgi:hypothetical protein